MLCRCHNARRTSVVRWTKMRDMADRLFNHAGNSNKGIITRKGGFALNHSVASRSA